MPNWPALLDQLDEVVVSTFDQGGVQFQKMVNGAPSGAGVAITCEFNAAAVDQQIADGVVSTISRPTAWIHFADFPAGVTPEQGDRLVLTTGLHVGTWAIDDVAPNGDNTGATVRLRKASR
jgi:hypothetical protein